MLADSAQAATGNADPAELRKFGDLAAQLVGPHGPMRPLHEINPLRLDWIDRARRASRQARRSTSVAAAASWPNRWPRAGRRCWESTCRRSRSRSRELHALESGARSTTALVAAEELAAEEPARFDVVTCMEMLEHVPDPASRSSRAARSSGRAAGCSFRRINRNPKAFAACHRRRRIRAAPAAQGHARVRRVHQAERAGRCRARGRPRSPRAASA